MIVFIHLSRRMTFSETTPMYFLTFLESGVICLAVLHDEAMCISGLNVQKYKFFDSCLLYYKSVCLAVFLESSFGPPNQMLKS